MSDPPPIGQERRRATKNLQRLGYRRIVQLLVYLIIIPTVLLLFVGILLMVFGRRELSLIFGILTVSFVGVVVVGVILVIVFVRREANLSELQADFVSKVSHELKTPLTSIRLLAETIRERKNDAATVDRCLTQILDDTDRLTIKIERLLHWGRMEAGRKVYELKPESMKAIVLEAARDARIQLQLDDSTLTVEIEEPLPLALVDREATLEAVGNLISNAVKYGGNPLAIELRAFRAGAFVGISVRDNGPGIARPEQRRIFEKFYRIDDRLSRAKEGSGLGLAIVKHVLRAHRGRIDLESNEGLGSCFTLRFPLATVEETKEP